MRRAALLAALAVAVASGTARAGASGALGVSVGWLQQRDYGVDTRSAFAPEVVGLLYLPTPRPRIYLRPGLRLGYGGLDHPEMPAALQVREHDLRGLAELSLLRDGGLIPAITVGTGLGYHWASLRVAPPLVGAGHAIAEHQLLPSIYGQVGVGLPFHRGLLVAEPHVRYDHLFGDDRISWRVGLDVTVRLF
jgi:hypothetical protein